MVFDYQGVLSKSATPKGLLGMVKDIERAYYIAANLCGISRRNITIITDVAAVRNGEDYPWEAKKSKDKDKDSDNPNIIRLLYPSINVVVESMLKFINKIHYLERGKDRKVELFSYFSGHGVTFIDPRKEARGRNTNCIVLIDHGGRERRYLSNRELLAIFHNKIESDDMNMVTVPIIYRKMRPSTSITEYSYHMSSIIVNSGAGDIPNDETNIEIFFLYDACHSGALSGLKYRYITDNIFEMTFEEEMEIPLSMGIGATNDSQEAPSCAEGSPFTAQVCDVIKHGRKTKDYFNVRSLHYDIHRSLHPVLLKHCYPTVSISIPSLTINAPVINCNS
jgi:hypothetical protein